MATAFRGLLGNAVDDGDWTARLASQGARRGDPSADPGMVAQPMDDPGYAMPNVDLGNLNQMPGVEVGGWTTAKLLRALRDLGAGR